MRQSINGILYDTEQATLLGEYPCSDGDVVRLYRGNGDGWCFGWREVKYTWWRRPTGLLPEPFIFPLSESEVTDLLVNKLGDDSLVKARA